jgi:hypothetical protein
LETDLGKEEDEKQGGWIESVLEKFWIRGRRQREQVRVVVFQLWMI